MALQRSTEIPEYAFDMMIRGFVALDLASGAFLSRSRGRSSKAPKYTLIVPKRRPSSYAGYFRGVEWDSWGRKTLRAWSDADAIEQAERKLRSVLHLQTSDNDLLSPDQEGA